MKAHGLFCPVVLLSVTADAQFSVRAGLCGGIPMGDMKIYYGGGAGVEGHVKYFVTSDLGIGVSSGFQHFFAKDWSQGHDDINYNIVPIRFSVTYYFPAGPLRPYIGAEAGPNMTKLTYTYRWYYYYGGYTVTSHYDYSHTRFGGAAVVGLESSLGSVLAIDVNAKYNTISKVSESAPEQNSSYLFASIGLVIKI